MRGNKKKGLIIAARARYGFGDCLLNAAHCWLWAKNNHSNLCISWYCSIYLPKKYTKNAFYHYFDVPSCIENVQIVKLRLIKAALASSFVLLATAHDSLIARLPNSCKKILSLLGYQFQFYKKETILLPNKLIFSNKCLGNPREKKLKPFLTL